jgi:hypothetical protein
MSENASAVPPLTPAERNSLRYIHLSSRLDGLVERYEMGELDSHDAWKSVQYAYSLVKGED